jgi:alpha-1,2-mannosyltransferase
MGAFLVLNAFALNDLLQVASPPGYRKTVLEHTWRTLRREGSDDSWLGMSVALDYAQSPQRTPLYTEVFFHRHVKFQYPPSALLVLAGLRLVDPGRIRVDDAYPGPWPSINGALSRSFLVVMVLATAALLELRLRRSEVFTGCRRLVAARFALVVVFTLTFYPVVKAFTLGNIQTWLNAILALTLLCWAVGKKTAGGLLTGLVCLIKPQYGLLLLWAAVRREWRFAVAGTAILGLGLVTSIAVFGWADHVDYLRVVAYISRHGEAYYPNQSMNGLLNRLLHVGQPRLDLRFDDHAFPPYDPWVHAGTLITSAVILLPALFWRGGAHDRLLDLCTMLVSVTLASPIAWEHHYGVLLPVFAIVVASVPPRCGWVISLAASYVLVSTFFAASKLLAPSLLNVAQSYRFAGGALLLGLLYLQRRTLSAGVGRVAEERG